MHPSRRAFLAQSSALLALTACTGTTKPDDDTTLDTAGADTGGTDTGAGDTGTSDSGPVDTADPVRDAACERTDALPSGCTPTSPDGEGPYWRPDAPERSNLNVRGDPGTRLFLAARVLDGRCQPVAGVRVYVWSANTELTYDFEAADPNLYGYQTTGPDGTVCFETLRPLPYGPPESMLPAHLHLNLLDAATGRKLLTTQLRFAGDPYLDPNGDTRRVVTPETLADGSERVTFDFVLPSAGPA